MQVKTKWKRTKGRPSKPWTVSWIKLYGKGDIFDSILIINIKIILGYAYRTRRVNSKFFIYTFTGQIPVST